MMSNSLPKLSGKWLALLAIPLAVMAAEGAGWWWMHPPGNNAGLELLEYTFPSGRYGYAEKPPDEKLEQKLHFDRGQTGLIQVGAGRQIEVNYFEWDNTNATGLADAFGHAPDVCMGNIGMQVEQFLPNRLHQLGDANLIFDTTLFRDHTGAPLYIFKLSWADGMDGVNLLREGPKGADYRKFKFQAVARRWRPQFARVMMLGVFGAADEAEAWKLARLNVLGELHLRTLPGAP
jgi:hypothetical protein